MCSERLPSQLIQVTNTNCTAAALASTAHSTSSMSPILRGCHSTAEHAQAAALGIGVPATPLPDLRLCSKLASGAADSSSAGPTLHVMHKSSRIAAAQLPRGNHGSAAGAIYTLWRS